MKLLWHKIMHWEFWPFNLIYYPLFPVWFFFSAKARSFFFFNAVNPSMKNGGMAMESKMDIYRNIPKEFIPVTVFVGKDASVETVLEDISSHGIQFPCIAKPDIGMKAFAVQKLDTISDLMEYLKKTPADFLIQEFVPYQKEVGIFYVRYPGETKGRITGIVSKEFLAVTGDGKNTLLELIKKDARSHLQLKVLRHRLGGELDTVLRDGERRVLVPYGSHTRGAKFIDFTHRNNPDLEETFHNICAQIKGFYYGRMDVLYDSFETLSRGKDFSIIEVNGAGSEPTHIYDPKHSLLFGWKEIIGHWNHMCKISIINHKKGHPYMSFKAGRAMLKENEALESQLKMI